jgi:signal recognition particle subunit SEC65
VILVIILSFDFDIFDCILAIREFEFSNFIQLWPPYLDSDLALAEGRRIAKEFCCMKNFFDLLFDLSLGPAPSVGEMSEICQMLGLRHVLEVGHSLTFLSISPLDPSQPFKKYPRLYWRLGRIRVQITNPDGSFCNDEIRSSLPDSSPSCLTPL